MNGFDGDRRRERVLEALHETTRDLMRAETTEQVAELTVTAAAEVLGMSFNTLWLYDEADHVLRPAAWTDEAAALVDEMPVYSEGNSLSWAAFESGEVSTYRDLDGETGRYDPTSSVRSEIILPLGEYGVMNVGSTEVDAFSDDDVSLARVLATNAEAAIGHTERAAEFRAERDRFRAVFDGAFDAMLLATDEGRYVDGNQSACDLFGLPKGELIGRSIDEFAPEGYDFPAAWGQFQLAGTERGTFPLVREDGERRVVEYAATTDIVDGQHLSVLRDVTEREERERALERQNERLDAFARFVSHDLRNPLTVASGRLELAREDHPRDENLETVGRALSRMGQLIEDLLTLARSRDASPETESVVLSAVARRAWESVHTVDATLEVASNTRLAADRGLFQQVLENLFRNAVEHGDADVTVTVGAIPGGFFVEDDGPGIGGDEGTDVFQAGFSTATDGTGFGLTIVNEIADAHGWTVSLADDTRGGARFEFTGVETGSDEPTTE